MFPFNQISLYIDCFYALAEQDIFFENLKNHNLFTENISTLF